jgi:hypothetical protein
MTHAPTLVERGQHALATMPMTGFHRINNGNPRTPVRCLANAAGGIEGIRPTPGKLLPNSSPALRPELVCHNNQALHDKSSALNTCRATRIRLVSHGTQRAIVKSRSSLLTRGRRRGAIVLACSVGAATVALANPGASAATGPVILADGMSGQSNLLRPVAADASGVIYSVANPQSTAAPTLYLKPATGSVIALPAEFQTPYPVQLIGSMIGSYSAPDRVFHYERIGDAGASSTTIPVGTFQTISADGYVYSSTPPDGTGLHLYDVKVSTGATNDFGPVPGNPATVVTFPTADGIVVESRDAASTGLSSLWYESSSSTGHFEQLASGIPLVSDAAVSSTAVAWLENSTPTGSAYDPSMTTVVRMSLDGSGEHRTLAPAADEVAITAAFTAVATALSPSSTRALMTAPASGGSMTSYPVAISGDLISTGDDFVVGQGGTSATAGLYSVASATSPAAELISAGPAPLTATSIALSPGRIVWRDDAPRSGVVTRTLISDNSGVTVGNPVVIAGDPAGPVGVGSTATSGGYVAYSAGGRLWLAQSGQAAQNLGPSASDDVLTLSGERLLQGHDDGSATLFDLAKSTVAILPAPVGPWGGAFAGLTPYQLFGNELASMASNGSIWIERLDTGQSEQVSNATVGAGQTALASVAVDGSTVAWAEKICSPSGSFVKCGASTLRYRDVHTLGPVITVPSVTPLHLALSGGYLAFDDDSGGSGSFVDATALFSNTVEQVAPVAPAAESFALSGSTLGWIGADGLPRVLALPHQTDQPWYLGDGLAPTTFTADGAASWTIDLTTSSALTQCTVTIATGATTVRTLACDAPSMAVGVAKVSWDGTDAQGKLVAAGNYTWTLRAAEADGAVLDDTGSAAPITGAVALSAHSEVALAASSSTGVAYAPVTMSARLATPSAGAVEFSDGATRIGSAEPTGDVAALTTSSLGAGKHSITASFIPAGRTAPVVSATVDLLLTADPTGADHQSVDATVAPGDITITTPYTPAHPLDMGALVLDATGTKLTAGALFGEPVNPGGAIEVTDSRAGNANWSVTVQASDLTQQQGSASINGQNLGLTNLTALTVTGNALTAGSAVFTDAPGPATPVAAGVGGIAGIGGVPHVIAASVNGGDGTIGFFGTLTLEAPTSTPSGIYEGTLVFTVG